MNPSNKEKEDEEEEEEVERGGARRSLVSSRTHSSNDPCLVICALGWGGGHCLAPLSLHIVLEPA
eukprot:4306224-Pyramimonas_sp.AAC.1